MRLNHSYSFQASAGPTVRRFRVTVEIGGAAGALRLTNIRAAASPGSGVSISFTATKTALLNCVVYNAAGKIIGVAANNETIRAGLNNVRWSGKNQQGLALPRGVYLIEMVARTEDGDRQSAVKSIRLR
jgi:hypothetical protein